MKCHLVSCLLLLGGSVIKAEIFSYSVWLSVTDLDIKSSEVKLGTIATDSSQVSMQLDDQQFEPLNGHPEATFCSITVKSQTDEWHSHVPIRSNVYLQYYFSRVLW